jgi:hypothetical protein
MKRYLIYLAALITFSLVPLSAETTAQQAEDKRPSWIERLFGTKEKAEKVEEEAKPTKDGADSDKKANGDDSDKGPAKAKAEGSKNKSKDLKFSEKDREVLEGWQKGNASWKKSKKRLPPGLQKKVDRGGELPPGWKKKLEVGTVLEPEVDDAAVSLPDEILSRLPDIPEDTEIVQIGDEIVRVVESTREIVDILSGIGLGDKK